MYNNNLHITLKMHHYSNLYMYVISSVPDMFTYSNTQLTMSNNLNFHLVQYHTYELTILKNQSHSF
jgi:hypothetical protein